MGNTWEFSVMSSTDAARKLGDASIDGIFIDGDHSYAAVVQDIAAWAGWVPNHGGLAWKSNNNCFV